MGNRLSPVGERYLTKSPWRLFSSRGLEEDEMNVLELQISTSKVMLFPVLCVRDGGGDGQRGRSGARDGGILPRWPL